jgi:hypothetical protein
MVITPAAEGVERADGDVSWNGTDVAERPLLGLLTHGIRTAQTEIINPNPESLREPPLIGSSG